MWNLMESVGLIGLLRQTNKTSDAIFRIWLMNVLQIIPDEKTLGDVSAKFKVRNYPTGTETTYPSSGSFTLANPTDVRFTAREVKFRVETARNTDWRVGNMQMFVRAGGGRG